MLDQLKHSRVLVTLTDQKGWFVDALQREKLQALGVESIDHYLYGWDSSELFAVLHCKDGARLLARTEEHAGPGSIEIIGTL